ncbi:MAG: hypothetical protein KAG92_00180, partial [Deltaproteobacteria bacterium]|nr:hypothetical protein [Deltaproteobacteria bacterium]
YRNSHKNLDFCKNQNTTSSTLLESLSFGNKKSGKNDFCVVLALDNLIIGTILNKRYHKNFNGFHTKGLI